MSSVLLTQSRRVSFADPIEEQQSPGGSVTRVSGAKGGKKSLRSKPSFLQPRRLSEESKRDHTTDTEVRIYVRMNVCVGQGCGVQ